jgi:hypothetical protein
MIRRPKATPPKIKPASPSPEHPAALPAVESVDSAVTAAAAAPGAIAGAAADPPAASIGAAAVDSSPDVAIDLDRVSL